MVVLGRSERDGPHDVPDDEPGRGEHERAGRECEAGAASKRLASEQRVGDCEPGDEEAERQLFRNAQALQPVGQRVAGFLVRVARERPEGLEPAEAVAQRRECEQQTGCDGEAAMVEPAARATRFERAERQETGAAPT